MRETRVLFGAGKDRMGRRLLNGEVLAGLGVVKPYASERFGGYTLYAHDGGWMRDGDLISEPGFTLSVFGAKIVEEEYALARLVRDQFKQDSVLLVKTDGEGVFV